MTTLISEPNQGKIDDAFLRPPDPCRSYEAQLSK
jgi:hypothetical protein